MKRLLTLFSGVLILLASVAALFICAAIYDSASKIRIESFFFQPNSSSSLRMEDPESYRVLGETALRNKIIQKFVTEYFYVLPNHNNIENRKNNPYSGMRIISASSVFERWLKDVAPEISNMANSRMFRTVYVNPNDIEQNQGSERYLRVPFTLTTWVQPNNFSVEPTVKHGIMYMSVSYDLSGLVKMIGAKSTSEHLESGGDPLAVFGFRVLDVVVEWQ